MSLIFLDTETTGTSGTDRMVQLAYKVKDGEDVNEMFKPPFPISFEAMAVHNITSKMIENKPEFAGSKTQQKLQELLKNNILVAHNATFDMAVLRGEGVFPSKYICTFKVAHRYLDKDQNGNDLSGRSLQYLRYALDLDDIAATAHDAYGDIIILEKLFDYLYYHLVEVLKTDNEQTILDNMIDISSKPILLKHVKFGKHRGKTWQEVAASEPGYLEWLSNQSDLDENLKYTLKYYLQTK
jgi:DNA polymerase III epsilon subunit-like protein